VTTTTNGDDEKIQLPTKKPQTRWLPFNELKPHPVVQRHDIDQVRANRIADNFNPALLGTLTISKHTDGTRWILDGMHRWAAALQSGNAHRTTECHEYEGLTVEQEAAIFRGLNDSKPLHAIDVFQAGVIMGDPLTVACSNLLTRFKFIVGRNRTANSFTAVKTLMRIYATDPVSTERAFYVATRSWGVRAVSVESPIISGLAALARRYEEAVDYAELIRKLQKMGEPGILIGRAKTFAQLRSIRVDTALAAVTIDLYNQRRRKPVDEW